jgi:exodeoxyribonuclease V gamma subunit
MPGLKIHTSNRLENLAGQLASVLAEPSGPPLASEIIVVQSRGMARWVSLELAARTGVCMNCEFPFPRTFVEQTLRAFFPGLAPTEEFSTDAMTWKIYALLLALLKKKEFAPVRQYLASEDPLRTHQLAEKAAALYDQYLVYRPAMLMEWERGSGHDWQSVLWRELVRTAKNPMHIAAAHESLGEKMSMQPTAPLPARISLFGIASLPPYYIRIFFGLAKHSAVEFFSLAPSREYFGHDLPKKLKAKRLARLAATAAKISDETSPDGNPLLVSLGKLNRDFTESRIDIDERAGFVAKEMPEQFVEPDRDDALAVVQRDILNATARGTGENPRVDFSPADRSIQIHSCHSPMREVEVLHDELLAFFENDPTLRPRDILVMTPDIERYAPFIEAVFRFPENERHAIPFSVADRSPRAESGTVETFLALLELPGSRCTATEIFSLLERPALRRRFDFDDDDIETMRGWIGESGIRWGIDAKHRAEFELPEMGMNTWRAGLRRLLLGLAMAGKNRAMFGGIMPCDEVEGNSAELLGRFTSAAEALFALAEDLPRERTLAVWADTLVEILGNFFTAENPDAARDVRFMQTALDRLREIATGSGSREKIAFRALKHFFSGLLDDTEQRGGFLTGGVTFCSLKPMRSIPARVVCLLGMGDQDFPRRAVTPAFDLMAAKPECGDRSARDDDRFCFLESLLSARERLYISFTGRSVIDNGEIPPSVLVSELLDCIDQSFHFRDGKNARACLLTEHRLHAFSPLYFDRADSRMFSFSAANAAASRSLRATQKTAPDFFKAKILPSAANEKNIALRDLSDFFSAPQKFFVTRRLGIRLDENSDALKDSEPFAFDHLERYTIKQELVATALEQAPAGHRAFAARGLLPLGELGDAAFSTLQNEADFFRKKVGPELGGDARTTLAVDLRISEFSLTGVIESIYGGRLVLFRCAKIKPKDRMRAWINHLAKCAVEKSRAVESMLIAEDESVVFLPVKNADELLGSLLGIYLCGLLEPLPFFPVSAFAYASTENSPMEKAAKKWNGSDWEKGERDEAYCAFCFAGKEPLDDKFAALAMEIFGPMLRNESKKT